MYKVITIAIIFATSDAFRCLVTVAVLQLQLQPLTEVAATSMIVTLIAVT